MIQVNINLAEETIDDIMVTALEGGINYWAVSAKIKNNNAKGAKYASHCVSKGGKLIIKTDEGTEHELGLKELKKGIQLFIEDRNSIDFENLDAIDADCIVQFSIFGEIVYG